MGLHREKSPGSALSLLLFRTSQSLQALSHIEKPFSYIDSLWGMEQQGHATPLALAPAGAPPPEPSATQLWLAWAGPSTEEKRPSVYHREAGLLPSAPFPAPAPCGAQVWAGLVSAGMPSSRRGT